MFVVFYVHELIVLQVGPVAVIDFAPVYDVIVEDTMVGDHLG